MVTTNEPGLAVWYVTGCDNSPLQSHRYSNSRARCPLTALVAIIVHAAISQARSGTQGTLSQAATSPARPGSPSTPTRAATTPARPGTPAPAVDMASTPAPPPMPAMPAVPTTPANEAQASSRPSSSSSQDSLRERYVYLSNTHSYAQSNRRPRRRQTNFHLSQPELAPQGLSGEAQGTG
ncbi:hypothetical protein DPMN_117679 [Dreissena polymorpha]|uniref:Uncharacterized protein n=1 Tax=Dreissena polymorpha TaxID=45954 RepID=A0A9D4JL73_DREPO|nr:hypothetical protein DPMN_117679 [Dreissena polymorpha]